MRGTIRSSGTHAFLRSLSLRKIQPGSRYTTELIKTTAAIKTYHFDSFTRFLMLETCRENATFDQELAPCAGGGGDKRFVFITSYVTRKSFNQ